MTTNTQTITRIANLSLKEGFAVDWHITRRVAEEATRERADNKPGMAVMQPEQYKQQLKDAILKVDPNRHLRLGEIMQAYNLFLDQKFRARH